MINCKWKEKCHICWVHIRYECDELLQLLDRQHLPFWSKLYAENTRRAPGVAVSGAHYKNYANILAQVLWSFWSQHFARARPTITSATHYSAAGAPQHKRTPSMWWPVEWGTECGQEQKGWRNILSVETSDFTRPNFYNIREFCNLHRHKRDTSRRIRMSVIWAQLPVSFIMCWDQIYSS